MPVISNITRFNSPLENNSLNGQGVLAYTVAYAATIALALRAAFIQHVCFALLTGNLTINANLSQLRQFDEVVFYFDADGTARTVTFGTGFLASGTLSIPINKGATVRGFYDGAAIRITSREIYA